MSQKEKVIVTGGTGYIGSHTCVMLIEAGFDVVVIDNLYNSSEKTLFRVEKITGRKPVFYKEDIRNKSSIKEIFTHEQPSSVIHFAGLKAVGESVDKALDYYNNNVAGTLSLLEVMRKVSIKTIIFSSSATVYGEPASVPIKEDFPLSATNPYGRSKLIIEDMLRDINFSDAGWKVALLRYFNPVGAHESGLIGEDPNGIPNNLMPYVSQVAVGKLPKLKVFGGDYPTKDGTGVRDYIHVVDLAKGHLAALNALKSWKDNKPLTVNLGTGQGYSVLDMVRAFEGASGKKVPYDIIERRKGDIAECFADPSLAKELLDWEAEYEVERMCEDVWRWQKGNPEGY